ncbi:sugar ABC transporter ATP-binding protein [Cellulomonas oligotrophica]|uniref:Simple sugar transport system ATP-binding protein n=1 Tax=Cellulomonas oligotrophica TaxID=931536 RepID=A0A7Y9FF41_9CELL|nr:sugar ABC transporter ATP-binding protein [Cellulomonas oligotrophica]NYD86140.1 simple sugar transport system ATP-binding protein [Cellulomonas oligotrophica]
MLAVRDLVKRYGATVALAGVDLELHAGEVLGLVGANGAGKSTLLKVVSGAERATSGVLELDGRPYRPDSPAAALSAGIATVHQDVDAAIVPGLSVAENLLLDALADGSVLGPLTPRRLRARARALVGDSFAVDLRRDAGRLTTAAKQQVLVARALAARPRVLVLDEPTAALSVAEQRRLLLDVRAIAATGTAVVLVSHHLGEVTAVSDRVVVLREGRTVAVSQPPYEASGIVAAMLGSGDRRHPGTRGATRTSDGPALLDVRGLRALPGAPPVDLCVRRGEVVGVTGLLGAGKTEMLEQVVGARRATTGSVLLDGRRLRLRHVRDAVAAGIGYVPEDRARGAEIPGWDVRRNVTLADLRRVRRAGLLSRRRERDVAAEVVDALGIVCAGPDAPLVSLSGGNRQKVVVGRWLAARSRVLVLDEPFRGVDLGARADIARLLRSGSVEAALVASSDPEEVLEVADRVLVMAGGTVVGEVDPTRTGADELADLMAAAPAPVLTAASLEGAPA